MTDTLFKMLFVKHTELLKNLVAVPLEISAEDHAVLWLSLFRAETEDELTKINALGVPVMNQAIDAFHSISNSIKGAFVFMG